jgi:hypothetical protein
MGPYNQLGGVVSEVWFDLRSASALTGVSPITFQFRLWNVRHKTLPWCIFAVLSGDGRIGRVVIECVGVMGVVCGGELSARAFGYAFPVSRSPSRQPINRPPAPEVTHTIHSTPKT